MVQSGLQTFIPGSLAINTTWLSCKLVPSQKGHVPSFLWREQFCFRDCVQTSEVGLVSTSCLLLGFPGDTSWRIGRLSVVEFLVRDFAPQDWCNTSRIRFRFPILPHTALLCLRTFWIRFLRGVGHPHGDQPFIRTMHACMPFSFATALIILHFFW